MSKERGKRVVMKREAIICVIILLLIILGNIITQRYSFKTINDMIDKLNDLYESVVNIDNNENINEKNNKEILQQIQNEWGKRHISLASFIEHADLEKIENNIIEIKSCLNENERVDLIIKIEETKFLLNNLENKYNINLQNIF